MDIRKATHANNSWYTASPKKLAESLSSWLDAAKGSDTPPCAIIAPHASYYYSAPYAATAYKLINPSIVKKIFIIGPSHYEHLKLSALTKADKYETPLYDLAVDKVTVKELMDTGEFELLSRSVEEYEHSIEMHLPFIAKVMESYSEQFTIVPILVNKHSYEQNKLYGKILSSYLLDPSNLFIISSDFCHWGKTYDFTYYDESSGKPIYQFIEDLDKIGMDLIEKLDVDGFYEYLHKYKNTICGRYPIIILMHAIKELINSQRIKGAEVKFLNYAQSSQCLSDKDFSVSYAAASAVINSSGN